MEMKNEDSMRKMGNYQPEEILENILSRVPIKTILRFSSACKSWYNLFRTPYFINLHSNNNPSNSNNLLLIMRKRGELQVMNTSSSSIHSRLIKDSILEGINDFEVTVVGCSNGIVCLHGFKRHIIFDSNLYEMICLWNPALKYCKYFNRDTFNKEKCVQLYLGFGFDNVSYDYKLLRFPTKFQISRELQNVTHAEIYSLSSDSWRIVKVAPHSITHFFSEKGWRNTGVYINGVHHWPVLFSRKHETKYTRGIITFDMGEEVFKEIIIPSECKRGPILFNYNDSLAMLAFGMDNSSYVWDSPYIWVMKDYGSTEPWTKICKIDKLETTHTHGITAFDSVRSVRFFPLENALIILSMNARDQEDQIVFYIDEPHKKLTGISSANNETLKDAVQAETYRESLTFI